MERNLKRKYEVTVSALEYSLLMLRKSRALSEFENLLKGSRPVNTQKREKKDIGMKHLDINLFWKHKKKLQKISCGSNFVSKSIYSLMDAEFVVFSSFLFQSKHDFLPGKKDNNREREKRVLI